MTIRVPLPPAVLFIMQTLNQAGFEAYVVGGAVRDLLLVQHHHNSDDGHTHELNPTKMDYDFTTDATPEQILSLFPESFYENNFGTVSITHEHVLEMMGIAGETQIESDTPPKIAKSKIIDLLKATKVHVSLAVPETEATQHKNLILPPYQITTFRSDGIYEDFRRPTTVTWGKTLEEDLERRDFTINAMAVGLSKLSDAKQNLELPKKTLSTEYELIDPHGGFLDLEKGMVRTVGDPELRFKEDALRMLRAVRFSVQLNMAIADSTFDAITKQAHLINHVSAERIRDELMKMMATHFPAEAIELLDETGLLTHILPELQTGKGVAQGGHHTTDVWTHSIDALRNCPSEDPVVRLATLLHDIAKPQTQRVSGATITFYNHEVIGARVARAIANRLRLSKHDCDRIFTLVRQHMFYYQPHNTDAAIRRFMRKVGLENIDDILDLREGDRLGSGARKTSWRLEEMKERMIEQLHQPMEVKDLAINGNDLMTEFHLKPGPLFGQILNHLFELVLDNPELNTREQLTIEIEKILAQQQENT